MASNEIISKYNRINTPEELLEFMSGNISYGYLGRNKKVYHFDDENFDECWYSEYILETKNDILTTCFGNCFDQTELERIWFLEHGYEIKTIFVMAKLNNSEDCPCHSFIVYKNKEDNSWNWFENSDFNNRGIHKFSSLDELLKYQLNSYKEFLKTINITDKEIDSIVRKEFLRPKDNCRAKEYLDWVINLGINI